jgi:hypothetical protein
MGVGAAGLEGTEGAGEGGSEPVGVADPATDGRGTADVAVGRGLEFAPHAARNRATPPSADPRRSARREIRGGNGSSGRNGTVLCTSGQSSRPAPEGTDLDAVPVKVRRTGRPPRAKGIYHVGCTDYPDPTYP